MDHVLQLHVEHHGSSVKRCDTAGSAAARFGKGADDASRAVLALAAMASLALLFLSSSFSMGMGSPPFPYSASALPARLVAAAGSLATTRTALFALSNAILLLLAADCRRWFVSAAGVVADDSCCEPAGDVLEKQHGRRQHHHLVAAAQQSAVQSCVPYQVCLEHKNSGTAPEAFAETVMPAISDSTTAPEAPEEQQDFPATLALELLRRLDNGGGATVGLETVVFEEPTCETGQGLLDELEIDELNKIFDEFIQSRRNKWIKEEACLQWHQASGPDLLGADLALEFRLS